MQNLKGEEKELTIVSNLKDQSLIGTRKTTEGLQPSDKDLKKMDWLQVFNSHIEWGVVATPLIELEIP